MKTGSSIPHYSSDLLGSIKRESVTICFNIYIIQECLIVVHLVLHACIPIETMPLVNSAASIEKELPLEGSCILYQDEARIVNLLDLPLSIATAQAANGREHPLNLLSCEPLEEPYLSTEPKTLRGRNRLDSQTGYLTPREEHENLIRSGLENIRKHHQGAWCLTRTIPPSSSADQVPNDRKRKAERHLQEPTLQSSSLTGVSMPTYMPQSQPPSITLPTAASLQNNCISNVQPVTSSLHISGHETTYLVPPHSSFILTSLTPASISLLSLALLSTNSNPSNSGSQGTFNLILLDPPWPNRSVRRAATYKHASQADDPFYGLAEILPHHLAADGFLACWITHATSTRASVEQLFASLDVEIVEEWTWAKVTRHGDPVVALGSQWRRGWEVLIVGRQRDENERNVPKVMRRLIVAVPDVHSRKPCLKELFEQMLLQRSDARVLEVFARHLVAGWCSVGDEVLRFNWSGHWTGVVSAT